MARTCSTRSCAGLRLLELTGLGGSGSRGYGKLRFTALACDGESLMDRLAAIEI